MAEFASVRTKEKDRTGGIESMEPFQFATKTGMQNLGLHLWETPASLSRAGVVSF